MTSASVIERQTARVMDLLAAPVQRAIRDGANPRQLAALLVAAVPSSFDTYGPFYDTAGVTSWLGITRQAVEKRAAARKLLAVKTVDRHVMYPVWQFDPVTRAVPYELQAVLGVLLPAACSGWTVAAWLRTPAVGGGADAVDMIRSGKGAEVLAGARRDAARWSL